MQSSQTDTTRKYLVIGGTGMLADMCHQLPTNELILASRFESNQSNLVKFDNRIMKVPLDYTNTQSKANFLQLLTNWQSLEYCVLWVHSHAHGFSCEVIQTVAQITTQPSPKIIHIFGTDVNDSRLSLHAKKNGVDYTAVKLGSVDTSTGKRWMTNQEISKQVYMSIK